MKTTWFLIIVVMAFQLALPNLQAQEQLLFRVEIPFNFVAGGVHLSAGKYLAFHANPATIQLIREDGKASAWIPVKPSPR